MRRGEVGENIAVCVYLISCWRQNQDKENEMCS